MAQLQGRHLDPSSTAPAGYNVSHILKNNKEKLKREWSLRVKSIDNGYRIGLPCMGNIPPATTIEMRMIRLLKTGLVYKLMRPLYSELPGP